jgi:hypothetical protein
MLGQLAGTAKQCFSKKRSAHGPRVRSPVSFSGERFLSNVQSEQHNSRDHKTSCREEEDPA